MAWRAICQRCGFEFASGQIKQEYTGLRVCSGAGTNDCWEPRHPQELLKGRADRQRTPWSSPEPADVFDASRVWNETTKTWDEA